MSGPIKPKSLCHPHACILDEWPQTVGRGLKLNLDIEFQQKQTRYSCSLGLTQSQKKSNMLIRWPNWLYTVSCFLKYDHDTYHMSVKSKTFFNFRPFGSLFPRRQNAHQSFLDPSIASSSSWQSLWTLAPMIQDCDKCEAIHTSWLVIALKDFNFK